MKRVIAYILSIVMLITTAGFSAMPVLAETNTVIVNFEDGTMPGFMIDSGGETKIELTEIGERILKISPRNDGTKAFAEYTTNFRSNTDTTIELKFCVDAVRSQATIAKVIGNNGTVAEIYSKGNDICIKNPDGTDSVLIKSYAVGLWYHIALVLNMQNQHTSVRVNAKYVANDIGFISETSRIESVVCETLYSPGFSIDDFKVIYVRDEASVTINADTEIELADGQSGEFTFTANVLDGSGVELDVAPDVLVSGGLTVENDGNNFKALIDAGVSNNEEFTITASFEGATATHTFKVLRYTPTPVSVKVLGDLRLCEYHKDNAKNTYEYVATAYDKNGNELTGITFTYSLSGDVPAGVSIDSATGTVTVTGTFDTEYRAQITADANGLKGTRNIAFQDRDRYHNDNTRWQVLLDYIDRVYEVGSDRKFGTPLIASYVKTDTLEPAQWTSRIYTGTPSNLQAMGNFYRALDGITALTGDESYQNLTDELYQFYIDNYILPSGFPAWGGHIYIDMENLTYVFCKGGMMHELKSAFPYMEPFYRLDYETGRRLSIALWRAVLDKSNLEMNRHIDPITPLTEEEINDWQDVSPENWPYTGPDEDVVWGRKETIFVGGEPFLAAAADIISGSIPLISNPETSEADRTAAITWIRRMLNRYYAAAIPDEDMADGGIGDMMVDSYGNQELNPGKLTLPDKWWEINPIPGTYMTGTYGDRVKNQFLEDLIDQGFVTPEREWTVRDAYYAPGQEGTATKWLIPLAEAIGLDTDLGRTIIDHLVKGAASYVSHAWDFDDNIAHSMLNDGTILDGFLWKKSGYRGSAGTITTYYQLSSTNVAGYCRLFAEYQDMYYSGEYKNYMNIIWRVVQDYCQSKGLGNVGYEYPGDRMELPERMTTNNPDYFEIMFQLYEATGKQEFLDAARQIADNMIKSNMTNGLFTTNTANRYIELGGRNDKYYYPIIRLEAAISGNSDLIPEYYQYGGYFDDEYIDEDTKQPSTQVPDHSFIAKPLQRVAMQKIVIDKPELTMSVGDTESIKITVLPDDAASKSVSWYCYSDCVLINSEKSTITALKPGKARVILVGNSGERYKTIIKEINITVK